MFSSKSISKITSSYQIALQLFIAELKKKYSSLHLSIIWDFFDPILYSCVFIFLKKNESLSVDSGDIPYSLFIITGLMLWQGFVDSFISPLHLIRGHSSIIKSRSMSPITIIFLGYMNVLFYHFIRISIVIITCLYFGYPLLSSFTIFFLTLPGLLFLGGLGFLLAPFTFMLPDLEKFISFMIRPLMFVSGVIFPINLEIMELTNPFYIFIEFSRQFVFGHQYSLATWIFIISSSLGLFIFGTTVYRRSYKVLCDRL